MSQIAHAKELPVLLTTSEVARALRCSTETVRRKVEDGSIAGIRLGGVIRIRADELDRILEPEFVRTKS